MLIALQGAVSQGVLWGIMVLGVFITFRPVSYTHLDVYKRQPPHKAGTAA